MNKVVVGLSGGVDSSVAAAALHRQGYAVEGLTLWLMKGKGQCCSEGMADAARLCEELEIPYHVVDTRELFEKNIVDYLVTGYSAGITPLPCSQCNKAVKFGPMLQYAREQLGIDLKVRIGINTGEMIGGVIGNMRLSYDYWGDTINVAARLQGLAEPDGITVSKAIWELTRDSYPYDPPRVAHLKNLGDSDVYDIHLDKAAIA